MIRTNLSQTATSTIHAILPAGIGIDKSSSHQLSQVEIIGDNFCYQFSCDWPIFC